MDASVMAVPAAGAIVSTVLQELSKAFMLKKWFHGNLSAKEAEELMMERGKKGSYLVRESRTSPGDFVLSVRVRSRVSHVVIRRQNGKYEVSPGEQFDDLAGLIEHYRAYPMVETSGDVLRLIQPLSYTCFRSRNINNNLKSKKDLSPHEGERDSFRREFESLDAADGFPHYTTDEALRPENRNKNRYRNIMPFDQTRVILHNKHTDENCSDYINANYINFNESDRIDSLRSSNESLSSVNTSKSGSVKSDALAPTSTSSEGSMIDLKSKPKIRGDYTSGQAREKLYIATQGCLSNTEDDFWHMVWQEDVRVIVMMTNEIENGKRKCSTYWPTFRQEKVLECYTIQLLSEDVGLDHTRRVLRVKSEGTTRVVYQYQFTSWPDHGTPDGTKSVLKFVREVNRELKQVMLADDKPENAVLCVHCSAGVGRTGTFIVLDFLLDQIRSKGVHCKVDVHGAVRLAKRQRRGMVQNRAQCSFIYNATQDYIARHCERHHAIEAVF